MAGTLEGGCGDRPSVICEWAFEVTDSEWLARGAEWLVERPLRIGLIIAVAFVANRLARRAINRFVTRLVRERTLELESRRPSLLVALGDRTVERFQERTERSKQRTETLGTLLRSLATSVILVFALLICLGELSINLGPLIAGAGVAGVALGFGAQSVVRDFLAGVFIVVEDQYGVGDIVDVGPVSGEVERISWRTTWLRDVEGSLWVVPNGEIRRVANKSQLWARAVIDVEIDYSADIDVATDVIKQVADEVWREHEADATVTAEPVVLGVQAVTGNVVTLRLVVTTAPGEQFSVARVLRRRIKSGLAAAGVDVPSPSSVSITPEAGPRA